MMMQSDAQLEWLYSLADLAASVPGLEVHTSTSTAEIRTPCVLVEPDDGEGIAELVPGHTMWLGKAMVRLKVSVDDTTPEQARWFAAKLAAVLDDNDAALDAAFERGLVLSDHWCGAPDFAVADGFRYWKLEVRAVFCPTGEI